MSLLSVENKFVLIGVAVAGLGIYLMARKAGSVLREGVAAATDLYNRAGAQVGEIVDTVSQPFGAGNTVDSVIPLYSWKADEKRVSGQSFNDRRYDAAQEKKPANYSLGSIDDGAIY